MVADSALASSPTSVQFHLDDSWDFAGPLDGLELIDARREAPALRFITSARAINNFTQQYRKNLRPFTLSGSGDFHHLSAVWLTQFTEPFTLISLDNHPDWDIRPPKWSCGAWINRALEMTIEGKPLVEHVQVWGCGSFECNYPWRLLGNRNAGRAGRLRVHPWRKKGETYPEWILPMDRETWRELFAKAMDQLANNRVYLTIDLDALTIEDAFTNWEPGQMNREDLLWAVQLLKSQHELIGGDICGGYSKPVYQTAFQNVAGWFDHPQVKLPGRSETNAWVLETLWPMLCHT